MHCTVYLFIVGINVFIINKIIFFYQFGSVILFICMREREREMEREREREREREGEGEGANVAGI